MHDSSSARAIPAGGSAIDPESRSGTHPPAHRWGYRFYAGTLAAVSFAFVTLAVLAHRVPYFPIDLTIARAVQGMNVWGLDVTLDALNTLGFPPVVGIVYSLVIVAIFVGGARWEAISCGFAVLGGVALNHATKAIVARPRPLLELIQVEHHITNPSFPAGHVLNFTALAGFLLCMACLRMARSPARTILITLLFALILLMGVARIHSGEHWASDVLGGYLLGGIWVGVTLEFYRWGRRRFAASREARTRGVSLSSRLLLVGLPCALATGFQPALAAGEASPGAAAATPIVSDTEALGATTAVPWNPPHALAARHAWERVVLLPGRVASLPLSGLGYVTRRSVSFLEDGGRLPTASQPGKPRPYRLLALQLPGLGDRTGLGGAAELSLTRPGGPLPLVTARFAATVHRYNSSLLAASRGPFALQYGYDWRPQEQFYGVGGSTSRDSLSDYALQGEFARGRLQYAAGRGTALAGPRTLLSVWGGPRSLVIRNGRDPGQTSYDVRFPALGSATLDRRVEHLVYGASMVADWRSGRPHWSRGGRIQLAAERYDAPVRALALHTSELAGAQFTKFSFEGTGGVSFMRDPRTVRFTLRLVDDQVSSGRDRMLMPDMARLGGREGLSGYGPGRFHDLDLLLTRVMYVFPLARLFECEAHSEWGAVYPDVWKNARLGTLKNSYGFSLRARSDRAPRGSLGVDASREGLRVRYALGGVE